MTRAENKARNSFEKIEKAYRKQISKKYGWKQSDYINWKIISDYYFCLYHLSLENAYIEVKPLFVDDLWWDIFEMSENKHAPKSLRGLGAFVVSGVKLKEYCVFDSKRISNYSEDEIEGIWDDLFREIEQDVADFLKKNPVPESFSPSGVTPYSGSYEAIPRVTAQSLPTQDRWLDRDVVIQAIPYHEVENTERGTTAIIGGI